MMDEILLSVFNGATESRNLEFKEGFNWENPSSPKIRDEIIKTIIALCNTQYGGYIILGIKTDTKKKTISLDGMKRDESESFIKNDEQIKQTVHSFCTRPVDIEIKREQHPEDSNRYFVIIKVNEFDKYPVITVKASKIKEDNGKPVIEDRTIYVRSQLAQWSSVKSGIRELEDIIEMSVKKHDAHIRSLGYTKVSTGGIMQEWYNRHATEADKLRELEGIGPFLEVKSRLVHQREFELKSIYNAAKDSTIPTFGWPIGVFIDTRDDFKPNVEEDGIKAVVVNRRNNCLKETTFDYWAIHKSGAFYLQQSFFESLSDPKIVSFNTRIVRITELFMYLNNLYSNLGVPEDEKYEVEVSHKGLKDKVLGTLSPGRHLSKPYKINIDNVSKTVETTAVEFNQNPVGVIEKITKPLFEKFELFQLNGSVLSQIVKDFIEGKVT